MLVYSIHEGGLLVNDSVAMLVCGIVSGYIVTSGHNTMGPRITNSLEKWSTYKCASGLGKVYDNHHTTKGIYPLVVFYLY